MSFTTTANYALQKPDINTELDAWGDDLNTNWDKVSAQMKLNADAAAAASTAAGTAATTANNALPKAGGTMTGKIVAMTGTAGSAPITLPHGVDPTSPVNGDIWTTSAALLFRIAGITKTASVVGHTHTVSQITDMPTGLAPLASPTFTGTPAAPTAAVLTNTTQLATTAHVYESVTEEQPNVQSGSYTLVASDAGKMVTFSGVATVTVNSSVFLANQRVDILQLGSGVVTIAGSATKRVFPSGANKLAGQYAGATIWFISASEYVLIGNVIV